MKRKPLVTVCLPCYNVAPYLERCMVTIQNQTYKNLEIIMTDDGSTDKTGDICDQYAKEDKRIVVCHTVNGGVSVARNTALDIAHGEYIVFVDPDDYIDTALIEKCVIFAEKDNLDIVMFGRYHFNNIGNKYENIVIKETRLVEKNEAMKMLFENYIESQVWQKFYKASIWKDLRFIPGRVYGEDIASMHIAFDSADRFGNIAEPLYYYFVNENTLTTSYRPFKWMSNYLAFKERYEFAHAKYPQFEEKVLADAVNLARLTNDNYIMRKDAIDEPYMDLLRAFMKEHLSDCMKTPYMKSYNKYLCMLYCKHPWLYSKIIKYIHKIYYKLKPNNFG